MGDSNTGMLDPSVNQGQFGFAFNDIDFSDRLLHLEIMGDSLDSSSDYDGDDVVPNRKRRRENSESENEDETAESSESDCSEVVEVKTYHISSLVLAAKSPFFYKLFKNGMRESQERNATLKINASEEAALMDLMKFMYTDTLSATTTSDLLGVLLAADKFEVTSCMSLCIQMLLDLPISLDSAILYVELPSSAEPLIDAATKYLVEHFRDFSKSQEEAMALPLSAVEIVLGSVGLRVISEDEVFDFILKWGRAHYPNLEERQEILTKRLLRFICIPYLMCEKLTELRVCPDFCKETVSNHVIRALLSNINAPYGKHAGLFERVYECRVVKVVALESPRPHCFFFWNLTRGDCADLFVSGRRLHTQEFRVGERWFSLSVKCHQYQQISSRHFGLYLQKETESPMCTVDLNFAVMMTESQSFESKHKVRDHFLRDDTYVGSRNVFGIQWNTFMADESEYFVDGILHLRAELIINNSHP